MIKIWIDDVRPVPDGYDIHCKSVNETIDAIGGLPDGIEALLDLDHDAGDYETDGGDYIRILDYIEAFGLNEDDRFSFHIHSANPVGRQNMELIISSHGWKYIY